MRKTIGIIILSVYIAVLGVFTVAEYSYQTGKAQGNLEKLKMAAVLNPFVSDYKYEVFEHSDPKDINIIKEAMRLEPLKAVYHMCYALELLRDYSKRTRASDQLAFHEIARAYELKPYSALYRKIYEQYAKPYLGDQ
jgi:hypothetical protein